MAAARPAAGLWSLGNPAALRGPSQPLELEQVLGQGDQVLHFLS